MFFSRNFSRNNLTRTGLISNSDFRGDGIIVNISSPGGLTYLFNTAYGVGKAAQDRMSQDFNMELKGTGVKVTYLFII